MFGLNRGQSPRQVQDAGDENYSETLAVWQIEHNANSHDRTPDQDRRAREHAGMVNAGLDVAHIGFVRWLVQHGRLNGAAVAADPTDEARRRTWPELYEPGEGL